jgi:hypothetical protein
VTDQTCPNQLAGNVLSQVTFQVGLVGCGCRLVAHHSNDGTVMVNPLKPYPPCRWWWYVSGNISKAGARRSPIIVPSHDAVTNAAIGVFDQFRAHSFRANSHCAMSDVETFASFVNAPTVPIRSRQPRECNEQLKVNRQLLRGAATIGIDNRRII